MPTRLLTLVALLASALLGPGASAGAADAPAQPLPSRAAWLHDVNASLTGLRGWIDQRSDAREPGEQLAIVLDIDNTSLQTQYAYPRAIPKTLRIIKRARARGVAVYFATGRRSDQLAGVTRHLRRAGFPVAGVCGREPGEDLVAGKVRCREAVEARGRTIIAMVGNRSTDLAGGHFERGWLLPSYGDRLA